MYSARKITNYSFSGNRYRFPSVKNGAGMLCESYLECSNLLHLEFDNRVKKYQVQPVTFSYPHQEKVRKYTPDVLVQYTNGSLECQELKYENHLVNEELQSKFFQIRNCLINYSINFKVVTDKEVFQEPRFTNLKRLYTYLTADSKNEDKIMDLVCEGSSSLGSLIANLDTYDEVETIYSMMFKNALMWDVDKEISPATELSLGNC